MAMRAATGSRTAGSDIRDLGAGDLTEVEALLRSVGLEPAGLRAPNVRVFGVRRDGALAGSAGYEREGEAVLLRSVAVRPELRGLGLGAELSEHALRAARAEGAREGYLLTETAAAFFEKGGWERVDRAEVDARFAASEQVRAVCPASAVAMRRALADGEAHARWPPGRASGATTTAASPASPAVAPPVRARFPALASGAAFFDAPGGTQVPETVLEAVAGYLRNHNANLGGWFATSRESDALVETARAAAARFLGGGDDEVIFGANMTSLNFALTRALGRELRAGDEVVVTRLDHDANVAPWLHLARDRGIVVRRAGLAGDLTLDLDHLRSLVGPRTRVVAFPLAANSVGTLVDGAAVAEMAHRAGALAWVDAVHYAPHGPIDARALGADVLLCSPYKFFGPHLGIAWGRRDVLARLEPYKVRPAAEEPLGHRFETGTLPHEALAGFVAAVAYLEEVGWPAIRAWEGELGRGFLDGLSRLPHIRLLGPPGMEGRVATFGLLPERETPSGAARRLAGLGMYVWHGNFYALETVRALGLEREGMLRVGFVHYNTLEEVERLLAAL